jgi:hypothetical protein
MRKGREQSRPFLRFGYRQADGEEAPFPRPEIHVNATTVMEVAAMNS